MLFSKPQTTKKCFTFNISHILLYLCSKFVTNIWSNSIFGTLQFYFTYEKFHPCHINKDKCREEIFELVRVKLICILPGC